MVQKYEKLTRYSLAIIILVVAINALGGGFYGMAGAKDVPLEWLKGSPFTSYFIPGLILFVVIGLGFLLTSVGLFMCKRWAIQGSFLCGIGLFIWICVQVYFIGRVSWLQPVMMVVGFVIMILSLVLSWRRWEKAD